MRITPTGSLSQLAGAQNFSYTDGPSNTTYLYGPVGLAADALGNVFIAEQLSSRVREVVNGNVRTFAGRLHFAGDGAPATSALLYQPSDLALDA